MYQTFTKCQPKYFTYINSFIPKIFHELSSTYSTDDNTSDENVKWSAKGRKAGMKPGLKAKHSGLYVKLNILWL